MSRSSRTLLIFVVGGAALAVSLAFGSAQRSRRVMQPGRVTTLKSGDDLQSALRAARYGDTIVLEAGATFMGPIVLPFKSEAGSESSYITIRTSNLNGISRDGNRLKPEVHSKAMPRILAPREKPALATEPGAHHYKFVGVEFLPAPSSTYVYNLIDLGSSDYKSVNQSPHHLIFDRCYVHSTGLNRARRGFALNSAETSIINSHVSGFAGAGDETQAVAGWNGPGPFQLVNNYLEGGGEVILFGGADPSIPNLVPSDIEIRRNYLRKPKEWLGRALIKGTFELKNARRVLVEANLIESEILATALVITVRNQNGKSPWSTIEDVEIKNNIIRHADSGVNLLGSDNEHRSQEAKRIRISNNLFVGIIVNDPSNNPYFLQVNGGQQITVDHNTVQQAGNIFTGYGLPTRNFVFRDNIVQFNRYGMVCLTSGASCNSVNPFCNCFPAGVITGNIIADNLGAATADKANEKYPTGNHFVSSFQRIGFADFAHGDWRLANSRIKNRASDGSDPGVNMTALVASGVMTAREGTEFR